MCHVFVRQALDDGVAIELAGQASIDTTRVSCTDSVHGLQRRQNPKTD